MSWDHGKCSHFKILWEVRQTGFNVWNIVEIKCFIVIIHLKHQNILINLLCALMLLHWELMHLCVIFCMNQKSLLCAFE